MLLEIRVENLLLIERAELRLGPGLNAITGETGAGKTMLAHALDLLLGGKPRPGIVRAGAAEAYVEGVFELPPGLLEGTELSDLRERLPEGEAELVLGRRVAAEGRSRAYVGGRTATAADLRELGSRLVAFYGQHEHRRLTLASAQLEALDGFCGPEHLAARAAFADAHRRVRDLRRELEELRTRAGARDRDRDLLLFEVSEIESLAPSEEEEAELHGARERLRRLDALRAAGGAGAEALAPEGTDAPALATLLAQAERLADDVAGVDAELDALAERMRALRLEAEDLGAELRSFSDGLEAEPGRLEQVEERLGAYERIKRKHGGSVTAVLAHAERCRVERDGLEGAEAAVAEIEAALAAAAAQEDREATALSAARADAAPRLAASVEAELDALAMDGASFAVELPRRPALGPNGAEQAEFLIAPNPGVAPTPLRDTASGGELSRVMLALMGVASEGSAATLVFDEVDAGIGGQTARAVGERLRRLGAERQVLCITHLPQIASLADRHFRISKEAGSELAETRVKHLGDEEVIEELCRMLGAEGSDSGARRHAEALLGLTPA
jgi:DNA repair protein RecN (Recombination protein N)